MILQNNKLLKYDTIQVNYPATFSGSKINLPDQPQLRNAFIQSVDLPGVNYSYYGTNCFNNNSNFLQQAFITFYFDGVEGIHTMPLLELRTTIYTVGGGASVQRNYNGMAGFDSQRIVWTKSYLTFSGSNPILGAGCFVIGVWYY